MRVIVSGYIYICTCHMTAFPCTVIWLYNRFSHLCRGTTHQVGAGDNLLLRVDIPHRSQIPKAWSIYTFLDSWH